MPLRAPGAHVRSSRLGALPAQVGRTARWQLINLTGDTHPIHVHLDPFQILSRHPIRYQIPERGIEDRAIAAAVTVERDPGDKLDHSIDDNERGRKDTIRVNPFVTMPGELMPFLA